MRGIEINLDYMSLENEFIIKTDMKRFQQVLLNLFSNAVKFSNRCGMIIIKASYSEDKKAVLVKVKDNGVGIKDEDKPKLFKLFGSIKDEKRKFNVGGIGLGLMISKMIVQRFNGHIDFKS